MKYEEWLEPGLQPPIGLTQEMARPSFMSGLANLFGSEEVPCLVVLERGSVYFEDLKVD